MTRLIDFSGAVIYQGTELVLRHFQIELVLCNFQTQPVDVPEMFLVLCREPYALMKNCGRDKGIQR